jgi:hypothetical protein
MAGVMVDKPDPYDVGALEKSLNDSSCAKALPQSAYLHS